MTLIERIEKRLAVVGLKPRRASELAGLSPSFVRDILDGSVRNPRGDTLAALAEVLKTTPEWLQHERGPEDADDELALTEDIARIVRRIPPASRQWAKKMLEGLAEKDAAAPKKRPKK